ncbi:2-hydroxychromene-2-carboxylate isomerase [Chitinibacter sp. SCUT-21]|uniref:2-hydroxychromene-2-carboxylate isomerase n=1 Tax=Chitinibacter sp. SCUT-21 TaxID=2970891 RepID=UPI0035A5FCF0
MSTPIDFYFDFSSPYGYIASCLIDDMASKYERVANWHAIVLDAHFQSIERIKIPQNLMRTDYIRRDAERLAAYYGIPFNTPTLLGVNTEMASRLFLSIQDRSPSQGKAFASLVLKAYFVENRNIAVLEELQQIASEVDISTEEFNEISGNPASRARVKAEIDMAEARGVFGSPFFIVDGERFWGNDRLPQLERWLSSGPF